MPSLMTQHKADLRHQCTLYIMQEVGDLAIIQHALFFQNALFNILSRAQLSFGDINVLF